MTDQNEQDFGALPAGTMVEYKPTTGVAVRLWEAEKETVGANIGGRQDELTRLRTIASMATLGPWTIKENSIYRKILGGDGFVVANELLSPDAAHIAAFNPATALQLLDELERARGLLKEAGAVVRENHEWHQEYDDIGGYPGSDLELKNTIALARLRSAAPSEQSGGQG